MVAVNNIRRKMSFNKNNTNNFGEILLFYKICLESNIFKCRICHLQDINLQHVTIMKYSNNFGFEVELYR